MKYIQIFIVIAFLCFSYFSNAQNVQEVINSFNDSLVYAFHDNVNFNVRNSYIKKRIPCFYDRKYRLILATNEVNNANLDIVIKNMSNIENKCIGSNIVYVDYQCSFKGHQKVKLISRAKKCVFIVCYLKD